MLNFRNPFAARAAAPSRTVDTAIRRRGANIASRVWTPPEPILNVNPSPSARAAFALLESQTNYTLDDFIQMRLERLTKRQPDWAACLEMNCKYSRGSETDIEAIWRLLYDELNDWMSHEQRDLEAARPLTFLAACMWKLGDLDKTATAASNADFAIAQSGLGDEDLLRLAHGFYGLGMYYWGIDLTGKLKEAVKLGYAYDGLLGGQFSVQIMQALAGLEALRGDDARAAFYRDEATALMWISPGMKLPKPVWQVKVPPGGPYPVDPIEALET